MTNYKLVIVFLFFFVALAATGHRKRHKHKQVSDKRISYGYDADITEAKFYAMIFCSGLMCGATLLTPNRLVTAAHCLVNCDVNDLQFFMGMNSRAEVDEGKADRYTATEYHSHPNYPNGDDPSYDVAVIYVDGSVTTTEKVEPISYALNYPPLNDYITCFGYGDTETGQGPERLQKSWYLTKRYEENMIVSDAEKTSVLPGDSGGPCIYNNQFIGDICLYTTIEGNTHENFAVMPSAPEILSFLRSHGL